MAYNEALEKRISAALNAFPQEITKRISKKKMFGGLAYLLDGKMTVGVVKNDLMVRVISEKMEGLLAKEHVRPMDFTNRPMKEFVYVSSLGIKTEEALQQFIELGIEHAQKKLNQK